MLAASEVERSGAHSAGGGELPNSLLAGKIQGNSFAYAFRVAPNT